MHRTAKITLTFLSPSNRHKYATAFFIFYCVKQANRLQGSWKSKRAYIGMIYRYIEKATQWRKQNKTSKQPSAVILNIRGHQICWILLHFLLLAFPLHPSSFFASTTTTFGPLWPLPISPCECPAAWPPPDPVSDWSTACRRGCWHHWCHLPGRWQLADSGR